ncbi:MAG: DUF2264 domain-containing protein [Lachnospiraceae bacterium]|nr:DUF2264 domain-containing protein [Lachnospiraceae bacterium]
MEQAFHFSNPDYVLSPYTGMTREGWIEAGRHLLSGVFRHIKSFEDPIVLPRSETKITYPHPDSPANLHEAECRAERFEGLARTFLIAAPLLIDDPDCTVCGFRLADYYRKQILRAFSPDDPLCVGTYGQLKEMAGGDDPFRAFQQTVETCPISIGLHICRESIWERYSKEERDTIAAFLSGFAHGNTVPQNWRFFNLLDLAFLYMNGYPIDEEVMADHVSSLLSFYAEDGWYRDGHSFDYYSSWAFQVYAPIWNNWYGYEHMPEAARLFEERSNRLMETYPDFFDEDGHTNMWGRSGLYRFAAACPLDANLSLKHPSIKPGLARRIMSGSLLQFLSREDFYVPGQGIPAMGFYGPFAPLIQGYSCAASPYWMGKPFLCLALPKEHPFWTAKEENGSWERLKDREVKETTLDGPALSFSNHKANGSTILRTGKVVKNCGDRHGMWNYGKLSYHSKYPWESAPAVPADESAVESQQYVLTDGNGGGEELANVTFWSGERDGVLYRRQFFNYTLSRDTFWMQAMNLADFPMPFGLMRADFLRLYRRPVTVTLGSYGFPDNGTEILEKSESSAKALILKGFDSQGRKKQLAMTVYDGWDELLLRKSSGTNPDSEHSLIVYARALKAKQYGGAERCLLISQTLTRESHEDFSGEELFPIREILYSDPCAAGSFGPITLRFKDGREKRVDFSGIEARLLL